MRCVCVIYSVNWPIKARFKVSAGSISVGYINRLLCVKVFGGERVREQTAAPINFNRHSPSLMIYHYTLGLLCVSQLQRNWKCNMKICRWKLWFSVGFNVFIYYKTTDCTVSVSFCLIISGMYYAVAGNCYCTPQVYDNV